MRLKTVEGLEEGAKVLDRADPLDLSSLPDSMLARTRELFGADITPEQSVVDMLKAVRSEGDTAVRRYAKLLDGADLEDSQARVGPAIHGSQAHPSLW